MPNEKVTKEKRQGRKERCGFQKGERAKEIHMRDEGWGDKGDWRQ